MQDSLNPRLGLGRYLPQYSDDDDDEYEFYDYDDTEEDEDENSHAGVVSSADVVRQRLVASALIYCI